MIDSVVWKRALAVCVLAWGTAAHSALPEAVQQEVQRWLDCYSAVSWGDCEIALGESGSTLGRVHRDSGRLLGGSKIGTTTYARAMDGLLSAAREGYPPAYEWIGIFVARDVGLRKSLPWRWLAAEHGKADAARQLNRIIEREGLGRLDRQSVADRMFLSWVQCHPASFASGGPVMNAMNMLRKASPEADIAQLIAQLHAERLREAESRAEGFLRSCAPSDYHLAGLPADEHAWVRNEVRARMAQTLKNIQEAVRKFPELEIFTVPEYQDLLPPP